MRNYTINVRKSTGELLVRGTKLHSEDHAKRLCARPHTYKWEMVKVKDDETE